MELKINKILAPIDFSENSKIALEFARAVAKDYGAGLILVYVLEPVIYPPDFSLGQITLPSNDAADLNARAREELDKLAAAESLPGAPIRAIVRSGKPFYEIIETAREEDVDLIIISSHGHSGVEHILFGSTSEKVVRKAPCPVLTLRHPLKGFDYKKAFLKNE